MISHMQSLFTEASFSGWDPAKFAHGCVLTDLEDGIYSWSDGERLAEARRSGVQLRQTELVQEHAARRCESSSPSHRVTGSNKLTKGASNTNKSDKKTLRVCNYFNNQKFRFYGNHERGDVCWLHVCANSGNIKIAGQCAGRPLGFVVYAFVCVQILLANICYSLYSL
jgi:hypothetical protein